MGSAPKAPKAPPPPPAPIDEADRAPVDAALAKKAALSMLGYRKAFLQPRGPSGGVDWQTPEGSPPAYDRGFVPRPTTPQIDQRTGLPQGAGRDSSILGPIDPTTGFPTAETPINQQTRRIFRY